MGFKDHRRRAEGKKVRFRRMPSPDECKLGTRVFESRQDEDDTCLDVERCVECGKYIESEEFEEFDGMCAICAEQIYWDGKEKEGGNVDETE